MKEVRNQNRELERERGSRRNTIVGLSIALGVFAASTLGLGIAYGISQSNLNRNETQLENVYQKNLYDLVESVNNSYIAKTWLPIVTTVFLLYIHLLVEVLAL